MNVITGHDPQHGGWRGARQTFLKQGEEALVRFPTVRSSEEPISEEPIWDLSLIARSDLLLNPRVQFLELLVLGRQVHQHSGLYGAGSDALGVGVRLEQ
ncbi:hypothetical protein [Streptomyces sp. NPDC018352]|uniref:hypothetical protein n=1 Tax=Streptomyces sp. NPDC018352 TaxID=3157194 RepID=UPI0033C9FBB9